ncbi:MAG TPA: 2-amino-4-hydroxy-6-hydroxymethyldihydropteridine diphosphokinase [Candidatus Limnocylindria bacterium]|nr:2-amino-4-hydroxy-6-hydroxymethyldihydropteridine diphosphokinase [Candidatus Limnocylindria bacterium]
MTEETAYVRGALALGSNLGDREAVLSAAVVDLAEVPGLILVATSSIYETAAVGGPAQGAYLNAVLVVDTWLNARALLDAALEVETAHGRVRGERWGPRTLDVDVLALGSLVSADPVITLPHPRAHQRGFVLVPWAEVDPGFEIPGRGTVLELLDALPADELVGVRPHPGRLLLPSAG